MAKNLRKSKEAVGTATEPVAPDPQNQSNGGTDHPRKRAVKKSALAKSAKATGSAKPAGKERATTPRKTSTTRKPRSTAVGKSGANEKIISDEDIRMRAYFIGEHRMREGIAGDSAHDWLEARRQLQEEACSSA